MGRVAQDCTPDDGNITRPDDVSEEWCTQQTKVSVHFDCWLKTLSLEFLLLVYIRSFRKGNFELYDNVSAIPDKDLDTK